jgi:hypothetical protein
MGGVKYVLKRRDPVSPVCANFDCQGESSIEAKVIAAAAQ